MSVKKSIIAFFIILFLGISFGAYAASDRFDVPLWTWIRKLFVVPPRSSSTISTSSIPVQAPVKPVPLYKPALDYEQAVINAVEKTIQGTVSVVITKNLPIMEECAVDPFQNVPSEFKQFFGGSFQFSQPCVKQGGGTEQKEVGGGSGFVVDASGLIVTNKHVVSDKNVSYTVLDSAGKKFKARVVALDPFLDIGFLRVEGDTASLKSLSLGDSDALKLGQTVIAIGNALAEFRNTVSVGVVSGLARRITARGSGFESEVLQGVIQTDAAINRGNSGGPLVNLLGEVIAINVAMAQGGENIGFAIPINQMKRSIATVKKNGKITAPYLGVRYIMITDDLVKRDGLLIASGALIRGSEGGPAIMSNSPASKSGLQAEDIIQEVNGVKVDEINPLGLLLQRYQPGETIKLLVRRGTETLTILIVLEERKE